MAFIDKVLKEFFTHFRKLIFSCFSNGHYILLVNRKDMGEVILSRGLRHENPISSYLFINCNEISNYEFIIWHITQQLLDNKFSKQKMFDSIFSKSGEVK